MTKSTFFFLPKKSSMIKSRRGVNSLLTHDDECLHNGVCTCVVDGSQLLRLPSSRWSRVTVETSDRRWETPTVSSSKENKMERGQEEEGDERREGREEQADT